MWNSFAKLDRLEKAITYCGLDHNSFSIESLFRLLRKRGITDAKLNDIAYMLISNLEPPACTMYHCKHSGGQSSFCGCSLDRIPGRCKIHREYIKRREQRIEKWLERAKDEALHHFPEETVLNIPWDAHVDRGLSRNPEKYIQRIAKFYHDRPHVLKYGA